MSQIKYDLTGKRYGALQVVKSVYIDNLMMWECICDCGKTVNRMSAHLRGKGYKSCGCIGKRQNIAGKRFGFLVAEKRIFEGTKSTWQCICDCGNNILLSVSQLNSGSNKSCGCKTSDLKSINHTTPNGLMNRWLYGYKHSASDRGLSFDLSFNEFVVLVKDNCHYCGRSPAIHEYWRFQERRSQFLEANGVDRLNNNIGYTVENCVSCCQICNLAKNLYSPEEFKGWITNLLRFKDGIILPKSNLSTIDSGVSKIFSRYKADAKKRNFTFDISKEKFVVMITSRCYYCDLAPFLKAYGTKKAEKEQNLFMFYNGIDRKDNTLGYNIDNCVPSCVFCNRGKRSMTYEDFVSWLEQVYWFNKKHE